VGDKIATQTIPTHFNVNATTYWGQNVYVVGNIAELGNWSPGQAVPLSAAGYPIWSGTVQLPPSTTIEFKYIKIDGGNVVWESGSNRVLTTPASGSVTLNHTWQ
jgi:alpha-amylase